MILDIIMVSFGRHELLRRTLESFFKNTDTSKVGLTLIDNGSERKTLDVIKEYGKNINNLILYPENKGKPYAQNRGAEFVRNARNTEFLMFCDSDIEFLPGWYNEMITTFIRFEEKLPLGGLSGFLHKANKEYELNYKEKRIYIHPTPPGCCMMMKSSTYWKVGQFKEDRLIRGVDTSYYLRMKQANFNNASMGKTVISHTGFHKRTWNHRTGEPIYIE